MQTAVKEFSAGFAKPAVPQVRSGDTVRVQQTIKEGSKSRIQTLTGTVIRTRQLNGTGANITVRWIASGVGVEKTIPLHSPLIKKVEVIKRGKVRRNYLSYLRGRSGRSARLSDQAFDREGVNVAEAEPVTEEPKAESSMLKAEDEQVDAEVTEIKQDSSVEVEESVNEEAKAEEKAAAADEPQADPGAGADEQQAPAEEVAEKLDQADAEDTRSQKPVE